MVRFLMNEASEVQALHNFHQIGVVHVWGSRFILQKKSEKKKIKILSNRDSIPQVWTNKKNQTRKQWNQTC